MSSGSSSSISGGLVSQLVGDIALVSVLFSLGPAAGSSAGLLLEQEKTDREDMESVYAHINHWCSQRCHLNL